jgi:hypothetical protein
MHLNLPSRIIFILYGGGNYFKIGVQVFDWMDGLDYRTTWLWEIHYSLFLEEKAQGHGCEGLCVVYRCVEKSCYS